VPTGGRNAPGQQLIGDQRDMITVAVVLVTKGLWESRCSAKYLTQIVVPVMNLHCISVHPICSQKVPPKHCGRAADGHEIRNAKTCFVFWLLRCMQKKKAQTIPFFFPTLIYSVISFLDKTIWHNCIYNYIYIYTNAHIIIHLY
jgi:hypothetical protein